jgi:hypothetical protein
LVLSRKNNQGHPTNKRLVVIDGSCDVIFEKFAPITKNNKKFRCEDIPLPTPLPPSPKAVIQNMDCTDCGVKANEPRPDSIVTKAAEDAIKIANKASNPIAWKKEFQKPLTSIFENYNYDCTLNPSNKSPLKYVTESGNTDDFTNSKLFK